MSKIDILTVPHYEAFDVYDVKVRVMGNKMEVKKYNNKLQRRKVGLEVRESDLKKDSSIVKKECKPKNSSNEIRRNNLARSFNTLLEYVFCNADKFESFVTLTFKENITDLTIANRHFNNWVSSMKRIKKDFVYIGVPEFQKRGAVHYHLMTNLTPGSEFLPRQEGKENMYDVKYWNHGFSSVFDLELADEKFSVALYLSKYFWKDFDNRLFGRNKILKSNNLEKASEFLMIENSVEYKKYMDYVNENYILDNKKDIPSTKSYIPGIVVYDYSLFK